MGRKASPDSSILVGEACRLFRSLQPSMTANACNMLRGEYPAACNREHHRAAANDWISQPSTFEGKVCSNEWYGRFTKSSACLPCLLVQLLPWPGHLQPRLLHGMHPILTKAGEAAVQVQTALACVSSLEAALCICFLPACAPGQGY